MRKQQQGYVLLVLMALVLSAGAGIFVTGIGKSIVERKAAGDRKVLGQLKNVKQRLLTYAATHPEIYEKYDVSKAVDLTKIPGPGYFPCPTLKPDAVAESSCGGSVSRGWLPRKISSREVSFEAEGLDWRRVWFVLDTRFAVQTSNGCSGMTSTDNRCSPLNTSLNADRIELNGSKGYVALLIYAGGTLSGQNRSAAVPDIGDYLDGDNADVDDKFSTYGANADSAFNDTVLPITKSEWDRVIAARVKRSATTSPADWCNTGAPVWFTLNKWHESGQDICN